MRLYVLVIPLLLVLELAASLERRAHEALFVLRHGCRPDDYRWVPEARGPAEPLPFPSEAAADTTTQPRRPRPGRLPAARRPRRDHGRPAPPLGPEACGP